MKTETLAVLALSALALFLIVRARQVTAAPSRAMPNVPADWLENPLYWN